MYYWEYGGQEFPWGVVQQWARTFFVTVAVREVVKADRVRVPLHRHRILMRESQYRFER